MSMKRIIIILIVAAALGLGFYAVHSWIANKLYRNPAFTCGNGRIEATEINIAAKQAGKVEKVLVKEGDNVTEGQVLVAMETNVLRAQLAQAEAKHIQAIAEKNSAEAEIAVRQSALDSSKAELEKATVQFRNAESRYNRFKELLNKNATSQQNYENAEAVWLSQKAAKLSAEAIVKQNIANLMVAKANLESAKANILAAKAEMETMREHIRDSFLKAPLRGRIQYRIAEPGEALSTGGRALNMVDLLDVYMTFFLPEEIAGKVKIGADARIVLDALPEYPLIAKITYVSSVAQFTPKTVETRAERQKLMFRLKAHIDRDLLAEHFDIVKTGIPGVTWVRLDSNAPWPKELWTFKEKKLAKEKTAKEVGK